MTKTLVCIPAYNCAPQIGRVIRQFSSEIEPHIDHILIVNNSSEDDTENRALEELRKVKRFDRTIIRNRSNVGYGGSLKVGFNFAIDNGFDWLVILHGDDQGCINDLLPVFNIENQRQYDCLLGARFHESSKLEGYSLFRTFGNIVFNKMFSIILGTNVLDLGAGLNAYRLEAFKNRDFLNYPDDLTFDYCGLMNHLVNRRRITFFPLTWREDDQVSNVKIISQALRAITMLFRFAIFRDKFFESDHSSFDARDREFDVLYSELAE